MTQHDRVEEPDAHAALLRCGEFLDKERAREVAVPSVVLHVEAPHCRPHEQGTDGEHRASVI